MPLNRVPVVPLALACALLVAGTISPARAQMSASDVVVQLNQLQNQIRTLTGQIEQLQHRNVQLEQQVRRMQEDTEFRFQQLGGGSGATQAPRAGAPAAQSRPQPQAQPQSGAAADIYNDPNRQARPGQQASPGQRGDVFNPAQHPNAPGAPQPLGSLPAGQPSVPPGPTIMQEERSDMPGSREPGSPLDLSTLAGAGGAPSPSGIPGSAGAPVGTMASLNPAQTPKEQFEAGYAQMQHKDFAQAETTFREFLRQHPSDRLAADAYFFLGESLYQRQRYQDAAESFLAVTTKYETVAKAPDALLRLGQSLAAMGQKEMACASFGEVGRKYPRASLSVKQGVEREMKRAKC